MPGHGGSLNCSDITEVYGADSLYRPNGIIKESENIVSEVYSSGASLFSAGGSTLCIQTMVSMMRGKVAVDRGAHIAFFNVAGLVELDIHMLIPKQDMDSGFTLPTTPEQVETTLQNDNEIKNVFITSPLYFGQKANIKEIAKVCKKYYVKLFVDNAHGSHLAIEGEHPIQLGADFCCDSTHKTLNSLTGSAILHLKDTSLYEEAKSKMSIFGSSSPSYLILSSIENGVEFLFENEDLYKNNNIKIQRVIDNVPFRSYSFDSMKLIIDANSGGYSGEELALILRENKIEPELVTNEFILLICPVLFDEKVYTKLIKALSLPIRTFITSNKIKNFVLPKRKIEIYKALRAKSKYNSIKNANGKISAENIYVCPPGQAIVLAGEVIDENIMGILIKNGIEQIKVVC